ncbi:putative mitochondrial large ribosomal subunit L49 [Aspergillus taichungensis]|uniref:Large ribosomal subunit protein mL49 n=1 Tax=Aspergillus taichungensis TaxID=482145 RepID=A0A2J5HP11_9EURO|nr:putative mitochondrial large ribosomal subunit L49 [Aspergillus taichungensis]
MASIFPVRPVCSAVRKQSTTLPRSLSSSTQPIAPSSGSCSHFSSLCSPSRLMNSPVTRPSQSSILPSSLGKGQTRTFLVQLRRQAQTFKQNAPSTDAARPPVNLQLTNLPYFIRRTASNQLPVYLVTKAGGTKQQTKIQKTEGDMDALRSDLAQYLGLESGGAKSPDVTINRLNGHIVVKGWRKPEIQKFLLERNF